MANGGGGMWGVPVFTDYDENGNAHSRAGGYTWVPQEGYDKAHRFDGKKGSIEAIECLKTIEELFGSRADRFKAAAKKETGLDARYLVLKKYTKGGSLQSVKNALMREFGKLVFKKKYGFFDGERQAYLVVAEA